MSVRCQSVESTHNLILAQFPKEQHSNASLLQLADRMEAVIRAGTLRSRLDAVVNLFVWIRQRDARIPEPSSVSESAAWPTPEFRREGVWISVLEASPELRDRYVASIAAVLEETDGTSMFAEAGLPTDRGLVHEVFERIFRVVLPAPRGETDLAKLFMRIFPTPREVDRFFDLPPKELAKLASVVVPVEYPEAWERPLASLLDAFCLLAARVQGLGLSEKLRVRGQGRPVQQSPFYLLARASDTLVVALRAKQNVPEAALDWKLKAGECRNELKVIVSMRAVSTWISCMRWT